MSALNPLSVQSDATSTSGRAYPTGMITRQQVRAARQLLGWSQNDLAKESGALLSAIKTFERGAMDPRASMLDKLEQALDRGGVIFLEVGDIRAGGRGVRLKE
jgi:transcriptional regulator with XRE-family HTH domain